ncbi:MAG: DUF1844 domain-containing protein [Candidatus Eisenbacteria bacterium]
MARQITTSELFEMFVLQQQQWTMIQLGKMVNPITGEASRDLDAARMSIDLLGMLQEKTKGNLDSGEERLLSSVLTTLRLNYVEEAARPAPTGGQAEGAEGAADGAAGAAE